MTQTAPTETPQPADGRLVSIVFPAPGTYAISIRVNGDDAERLSFRVDLAAGADGEAGPPSTSTGRPGDAGYL